VRRKADINQPDHARIAPLAAAASAGAGSTVAFLISQGANVDAPSAHGDAALMLAASAGHPEVVKQLLGDS